MSTLATIPLSPFTPSRAPSGSSEERGVMRNVSWNFYNRLTDAIGERSSIRVAFDGKDVEIMVIGGRHESLGDLLSVRLKPFLACAGRRGHSVVARWGVRKADGEETPHPELGSCRITDSGWDLTAVAPPPVEPPLPPDALADDVAEPTSRDVALLLASALPPAPP